MNKNPYKKKEKVSAEDWKCMNCVWKDRGNNSKIEEGFCGKNERINEKGCPLFVRMKECQT